ncbi:choice-of-anchor B family protein, partial [candidate division KSB1 bacterium]|nr:choice-of-anchor B family protein [candidate division KSB1 bacterium]NIR71330.1 choice-of-anchor B family protein [candidate division KSB1 bacterium]NIS26220.1 choice-of-anchor B family protein [candidate division KSB1 bacterium]NIT74650.1 choice-of-anchor B family protein [candidate division KSB1 bacterium]NIU26868.1 choice-of-anchor B family protein [candidate division KSB1 bacterium]
SGGDQNQGHDAAVIDNILFDFHWKTATNIYDVTDPSNPTLLGAINAPFIRSHHSGWPTADGRFLFLCDELAANRQNRIDQPDLSIWDISDFSNPELVARFTDPSARIHNLYIIDDYAYVSYYAAGFRVFDVSEVTNIVLVDEFDTSPSISGRAIFGGAFGVYPFAPSGNIYVSDTENGLFIFAF